MSDELLTLVEREEEMVKRGVKAANLAGIRQRILTKFLQLVRSPDHNPEISRFEKVIRLLQYRIMYESFQGYVALFIILKNKVLRIYPSSYLPQL